MLSKCSSDHLITIHLHMDYVHDLDMFDSICYLSHPRTLTPPLHRGKVPWRRISVMVYLREQPGQPSLKPSPLLRNHGRGQVLKYHPKATVLVPSLDKLRTVRSVSLLTGAPEIVRPPPGLCSASWVTWRTVWSETLSRQQGKRMFSSFRPAYLLGVDVSLFKAYSDIEMTLTTVTSGLYPTGLYPHSYNPRKIQLTILFIEFLAIFLFCSTICSIGAKINWVF